MDDSWSTTSIYAKQTMLFFRESFNNYSRFFVSISFPIFTRILTKFARWSVGESRNSFGKKLFTEQRINIDHSSSSTSIYAKQTMLFFVAIIQRILQRLSTLLRLDFIPDLYSNLTRILQDSPSVNPETRSDWMRRRWLEKRLGSGKVERFESGGGARARVDTRGGNASRISAREDGLDTHPSIQYVDLCRCRSVCST